MALKSFKIYLQKNLNKAQKDKVKNALLVESF